MLNSKLLKQNNKLKKPPAPSFFESLEYVEELDSDAAFVYPLKVAQKYGDVVYIPFLKQYFIAGPEAFEHILKTNQKNYIKRHFRYENIYYKRIAHLFGSSILVSEGNIWREHRKVIQPYFHTAAIKLYVPDMVMLTQNLINEWKCQLRPRDVVYVDILQTMNELTLKIAFQVFANTQLPEKNLKQFSASVKFCNFYITHSSNISPWKPTLNNIRFYFHVNRINRVLNEVIQQKRLDSRENPVSQDVLSLLLNTHHESTHQPLTDQQILDEFKTIILTGHETTGCSLAWTWYLLAKNPHYLEWLKEELDTILQGRAPAYEDLLNLPRTKAILSESFRLYPPIWMFSKTAVEDDEILGYAIPKGATLALSLFALHRHPKHWDHPHNFYPERFLNGHENPNRHPFVYLPFSAGHRGCIANHFGVVEASIILATMAQQVQFSLKKGQKHPAIEPCVSLRPKGKLMLKVLI